MKSNQLDHLVDNLQGLVFRYAYAAPHVIEYVNTFSSVLLDKPSDELIGQSSSSLFLGVSCEEKQDIENIIKRSIDKKSSFQIEYEFINPKGKKRWLSLQGQIVYSSAKQPESIEGFIQDITLRKNSERTLRKMKDFHKQAHEEIDQKLQNRKNEILEKNAQLNVLNKGIDRACIVATADLKGTIIDVNDMYCQVSGYCRDEVLKKKQHIISYEKDNNELYKELWVTVSAGKIWRGEIQTKTKYGEYYWLDSIIVPFLDKHNKPYQFFSISTLISDRKKTEKELHDKAIEIKNKNIALLKQQAQIEKQSQALQEIHKNITASIEYAKYLQTAILPDHDKVCAYFSSFFALYLPKDVVSGDFYWFYHDENEEQSYFAVVDCTGHGVPGAFMSMLGYELLENIVVERRICRPDVVLEEMDRGIVRLLKQNTSQAIVRDGMDMSFVRVDHQRRRLIYAGAKNEIIIESQGEITEYKATKYVIGSYEEGVDKEFEKKTISYKSGDRLYMFSDGFVDQFGGEEGKKYYKNRFRNFLTNHAKKNLRQVGKEMKEEHYTWKGNNEQVDDITVLGVKLH